MTESVPGQFLPVYAAGHRSLAGHNCAIASCDEVLSAIVFLNGTNTACDIPVDRYGHTKYAKFVI